MNNKLLRITQLDAIHLDNEIYKILYKLIQECSTHFTPGLLAPYEPEINLVLKLLILNYSVLKQGQTFGQKLLMIKYKDMSTTRRIMYMLLNSFTYVKERCDSLPLIKKLLRLEAAITILSFINLSMFLKSGVKPTIIDRILYLNQIYDGQNVRREFGSKYMTRELLWNSFIEVLVYIVPLINYHKIRRVWNGLNPFHRRFTSSNTLRKLTVNTMCAYCGKPPILPHHMGCSHIFCYTCLKANLVADAKYECPSCEFSSVSGVCERVTIHTLY